MDKIFFHIESVYNWKFALCGCRLSRKNKEYDSTFNNLGTNDLRLSMSLSKRGDEESKFLRSVFVNVIAKMPLYWWNHFITYRLGIYDIDDVELQSESTMYNITKNKLSNEDFLFDKDKEYLKFMNDNIIQYNNENNSSKRKPIFYKIISYLTNDYLYERTMVINYQAIKRIVAQRKNHKLFEWNFVCEEIKKQLPYFEELIGV